MQHKMFAVKIFIFLSHLLMLFEPSELVNVECEYSTDTWSEIGSVYICYVQKNLNIESKESAIVEHVNRPERGKFAVTAFYAYNRTIQHFPRGLQKIFVNLKAIEILGNRIKELHQEDLKEYVKLESLWLAGNEIEILEDGLFSHNPHLKFVNFYKNKIFHIDEHVFDQLHNLNQLWLESNECINKEARTNAETKELIKEIKTKCYSDEFSTIDKEIQQLEEAVTYKTNKNCQELEKEFKKLENHFQTSKISSHTVIKERFHKVSNERVNYHHCMLNEKLLSMQGSFSDLRDEIEKFKEQSCADNKDNAVLMNETIVEMNDEIKNIQKAVDEKFADSKEQSRSLKDEILKVMNESIADLKIELKNETKQMLEMSATAINDEIKNMQKTNDEKFVELEKSHKNLKAETQKSMDQAIVEMRNQWYNNQQLIYRKIAELMEVIAGGLSNITALDASIQKLMLLQN